MIIDVFNRKYLLYKGLHLLISVYKVNPTLNMNFPSIFNYIQQVNLLKLNNPYYFIIELKYNKTIRDPILHLIIRKEFKKKKD